MSSESGRTTHVEHIMCAYDGREVPVNGIRYEGKGKHPERDQPQLTDQVFDHREGPVLSAVEPALITMIFDPAVWLTDRLHFWQRQLRLLDWDITAEFSTYNEMGGRSGLLWENEESKEARIRVLAREDWPSPSTSYGMWDTEEFLLHELLHIFYLHWETSDDHSDPIYIAKEQAVDLLSNALLRLDRGEPR